MRSADVAHVEAGLEDIVRGVSQLQLPHGLHDLEILSSLKANLQAYADVLTVVADLSSPSLRPRHWERV